MQEIGNQQPAEKRVSSLSFCTHWRRFSWSRKKLTFVIVLKNSTPKTRKHLVSFGKLSLLVKILAENGMPRSLASWFFGWMEGFFRLLFSTTDETLFQLAFNKSLKMRKHHHFRISYSKNANPLYPLIQSCSSFPSKISYIRPPRSQSVIVQLIILLLYDTTT